MAMARKGSVIVLVGTHKGAFIFRSDARRKSWSVEGPHLTGLQVHHLLSIAQRTRAAPGRSRLAACPRATRTSPSSARPCPPIRLRWTRWASTSVRKPANCFIHGTKVPSGTCLPTFSRPFCLSR